MKNLHKLIPVLMTMLCSTWYGCTGRVSDGGGYTQVSGTVLDSLTGLALDSARITMVDTLTWATPIFSDTLGKWQHAYQGTGTVTYYCQKNGYLTKLLIVNPVRENQRIQGADFLLTTSN